MYINYIATGKRLFFIKTKTSKQTSITLLQRFSFFFPGHVAKVAKQRFQANVM